MVDRHVAEQGDLRFHLVGNRIFAPADQNIRLKAHALQLFDAGLCRFRFQLLGCFQIRNQGHMDQNGIFMAYVVLELTDGLQERLTLNIADGSAYLYNSDPVLVLLFGPIEPALDLICDVRNHLYGAPAVISVTLFLQNRPVNFTGGHVGIFIQAFINKSLIMTEIQVCLRTVVGNKNLAVLNGVHRTRVYIDIGIKLLHRHLITSGFQKTAQRSCRNSLAQTGNHTACHKYIFYCHHIFLLALACLQ